MTNKSSTTCKLHLLAKEHLLHASFSSLLQDCGFSLLGSSDQGISEETDASETDADPVFVIVDYFESSVFVLTQINNLIAEKSGRKIVVISNNTDPLHIEKCFRSGAAGYVLGSASKNVLTTSIQLVELGQTVFPSDLMRRDGTTNICDKNNPFSKINSYSLHLLENNEHLILQMLASGYSNKQIGLVLDLPDTTVKVIIKRISNKIGAINRVQAAVWAVTNGIEPFDSSVPENEALSETGALYNANEARIN